MRSGKNKKRQNVEDIVSFVTRRHDLLPFTFVAKDLENLPAIGFDNMTELDLL